MSDPLSKTTRAPMWQIVPGLLIYNLFGRHILTFTARRTLRARAGDPAIVPKCEWISFKAMKEVPHAE